MTELECYYARLSNVSKELRGLSYEAKKTRGVRRPGSAERKLIAAGNHIAMLLGELERKDLPKQIRCDSCLKRHDPKKEIE